MKTRCNARLSGERGYCQRYPVRGRARCRFHGGLSTGACVLRARDVTAAVEGRRRWLDRMRRAKAIGLIGKIPGGRRDAQPSVVDVGNSPALPRLGGASLWLEQQSGRKPRRGSDPTGYLGAWGHRARLPTQASQNGYRPISFRGSITPIAAREKEPPRRSRKAAGWGEIHMTRWCNRASDPAEAHHRSCKVDFSLKQLRGRRGIVAAARQRVALAYSSRHLREAIRIARRIATTSRLVRMAWRSTSDSPQRPKRQAKLTGRRRPW
jgi:hypothetical protein